MTKKKVEPVKKYKVIRGIERTNVYRYEPGDIVTGADIPPKQIAHWVETGVLEEVE